MEQQQIELTPKEALEKYKEVYQKGSEEQIIKFLHSLSFNKPTKDYPGDVKENSEIIADLMKQKELWEENIISFNKNEDKELPMILLPGKGKLISEFASELSNVLKQEFKLFFRADLKEIVEIQEIRDEEGNFLYHGFNIVKPNRLITLIENYVNPGIFVEEYKGDYEFKSKSISGDLANTLLQSEIMQSSLPLITRIFSVPFPILHKGQLTFPQKGYDKRFNSWLPYNSPTIENPNMGLEESKRVIYDLYKEFCFQTKQDYVNAVAGLLTPFLRGLFKSFSTRTPIFFYIANRERAGKDYCAGITGITYEGVSIEESPISNSENARSNNTEELRKKILAAMINGKKRMHFSNNKGYINNAVFEAVTTAEQYTDRILGKSETATFENELDFSLSGNVGVGFTPDLANRCRFVRLFLDIEDANSREFDKPNLHEEVKAKRGLVLSALYGLVNNWIQKGMPKGSKNFSSFPEWAQICGGIMEAAGYDNPANPDKETLGLGGDSETQEMKELFELGYELRPEQWMKKHEIKDLIGLNQSEVFGYLDFSSKSDQTKFGHQLNKFVGRVLSDIRLVVKDQNVRSARQEFMFTKEKIAKNKEEIFGNLGNNGNLTPWSEYEKGK